MPRSLAGIVVAILAAITGAYLHRGHVPTSSGGGSTSHHTRTASPSQKPLPQTSPSPASPSQASPSQASSARTEIGFRSRAQWMQHYTKHGAEFGSPGADEYLHLAQAMRDRPAGGNLLERVRADGVITRFDRGTGAFLAENPDGTIRTFFKPDAGESYFLRQSDRD